MIVDASLSFKKNDSEILKTHWRISDSTNSTAKKTNEGKIQTLVKNFWFRIFLLQSATWIPLKDYKYILLKSASFHLQKFPNICDKRPIKCRIDERCKWDGKEVKYFNVLFLFLLKWDIILLWYLPTTPKHCGF